MSGRTVHTGELGREDVRALLAGHFAEMRGESPPSACHVMTAEALDRPDILFLTLREADGTLAAIGALRTLDTRQGEVKSMRTTATSRGTGAGRAMLDALVDAAREAGMIRLSMETGNSALFAPANRLYQSAGFEPCGPFAGYLPTDFTLFYTRAI